MSQERIAIVGGGPIGLLCAYILTMPDSTRSLPGNQVVVFDPGIRELTAGRSAGAFVDPDWTTTDRRIMRWQRLSMGFYSHFAKVCPEAVMLGPINVLRLNPRVLEPGERHLTSQEISRLSPHFQYATTSESYRINPPLFLDLLEAELLRRGVRFVKQQIKSFGEVSQDFGIQTMINATGILAQSLTGDQNLVAVRGHCIRVRLENAPPEVRLVVSKQTWYIGTGPDECRIGGTSEEGCWNLQPNAEAVEAIFQRVQEIVPVQQKNQLEVSCGLRPRRKGGVRLEVESLDGGINVVHCYGHGGEGFTLGPGSAKDAASIVMSLLSTK